jgi:hypothetical protein
MNFRFVRDLHAPPDDSIFSTFGDDLRRRGWGSLRAGRDPTFHSTTACTGGNCALKKTPKNPKPR